MNIDDLAKLSGNNKCGDCGSARPVWASVELGVLVCIKCSGVHRSLSLSHVKSTSLDKWKEKEYIKMKDQGGNDVANRKYEKYPLMSFPKPNADSPDGYIKEYIEKKYKFRVFESDDNEYRNLKPKHSPFEENEKERQSFQKHKHPQKKKKKKANGKKYVAGNVEFSGIIQVYLKHGKNLIAKDLTGKSDPYVKIKSGPDQSNLFYPGQKSKSQIIMQNLNPVWDELLSVSIVDIKKDYLYIFVLDWDRITANDPMGNKILKLSDIEYEKDILIKLDNVKKGEICINVVHIDLK